MLVRFDPFREMDRLTRELWNGGPHPTGLPMDAYREGEHVVVQFDLPGVEPDSVDVTVEHDTLTVAVERPERGNDGAEWLAAERPRGRVTRQLILGEGLDTERIEASYDLGVLTLTIPMAEQAKARKVAVTAGAGNGAKAIDTSSTEA